MRIKQVAVLIITLLLLASCGNRNEIKAQDYLGEIYSIALDSIMEKDEALSNEMEFIAIDLKNSDELTGQDKEEITKYFHEKYKVEVMEASYEELKEKGLYNPDTLVLKGVLLKIENVDFVSNATNDFIFEGAKYRAGDGAVGVKGIVYFKNDRWKLKESKETWIS